MFTLNDSLIKLRIPAASCGENASGEIDTRHLPALNLTLVPTEETTGYKYGNTNNNT